MSKKHHPAAPRATGQSPTNQAVKLAEELGDQGMVVYLPLSKSNAQTANISIAKSKNWKRKLPSDKDRASSRAENSKQ